MPLSTQEKLILLRELQETNRQLKEKLLQQEEKPEESFLQKMMRVGQIPKEPVGLPMKEDVVSPTSALRSGFFKGASAGYVPETAPKAIEKYPTLRTVGEFGGFGVPLGVAGKVAGAAKLGAKLPTLARAVTRGATTGTIYGAGRKPEKGEDRLTNALYDAVLFGGFNGALAIVGKFGARALAKFRGKATGLDKPEKIVEVAKEAIGVPEKQLPRNLQEMLRGIDVEDAKALKALQTTEPLPRTQGEFLTRLKRSKEDIRKAVEKSGVKISPEPTPVIPKTPEPQVIQGNYIQNVIEALKKAKPIRGKQEALYSQERTKRIAKAMAVSEKIPGEAGFRAMKAQLKGELPKVQFESIRGGLTEANVEALFDRVKKSSYLTGFEKITAGEGLVKMFGEGGGRVPTKGELILLEQVFPEKLIDALMKKRPFGEKLGEAGLQLINIPRSMMASFDLSFGGRQGAFAAPRFRKQFYDAWKKQFKIFGSEKAYQASREALAKHPDFKFARENKLAITELGKVMTQREERFASQWAEKIPLVGKGIRASGRAYTAFANKFRMDMFSELIKKAEAQGQAPRQNRFISRQIADFVNNATGRGSLGAFEKAALGLNAFFFSPRLMASRLKLLNPVYYVKQPKFVRTEALKTALTAAGTATTILTLAKLGGLEVGDDPRSADFGKIKIGKARIDIGAGFQQYIRAFAQMVSGKYVSSVTGKEITLGEGYKPLTRKDIFLRQVESKEAPIFSLATRLMEGQDWTGEQISIPKEVGSRFVPMVIADMIDLARESPELLPLGIPATFGVGLMVYESYPPEVREFNRFASQVKAKEKQYKELKGVKGFEFYQENKQTLDRVDRVNKVSRELHKLSQKIDETKESKLPDKLKEQRIANLNNQMIIWARSGYIK